MRKFLLLVLLFASVSNAFAQSDSLLQKFKYRIDHFRAVNLNVNGNGGFDKSESGAGTNKNSSFAGGFGISINTIKSTDKKLLTSFGSISSGGSFTKADRNSNTDKLKNLSAAAQFSILNKWFLRNSFTELGAEVYGNTYSYKNSSSNFPSTLVSRISDYSLTLNTGLGKGRLENITDMQNALWLNNVLKEAGRLSRPLSPEELNELGRSVTKANNTRILDSRKKTQFMLETVDNYLQQKGLISKTDINYFSSLNDILFFAFNNYRLSGKEKFIRVSPSISGSDKNQDQSGFIDNFQQNPVVKSALISIGFNNYIPVNLKHQNNYGAALRLNYISYKSTDKYFSAGVLTNQFNFNTSIKQAGIRLFYEHAFYPGTRTVVNLSLQSESGYQKVESDDGYYGLTNISGQFNYFISYRTRLTIDLGAMYRKNIYTIYQNLQLIPDDVHLFVNTGLNISL